MKKTITLLLLLFSLSNLFAQSPPPGFNYYYAFDENNDGYASFDINRLTTHIRNKASIAGFDLSGYTVVIFGRYGAITTAFYTNQVQYAENSYVHIDYVGGGPNYNPNDLNFLSYAGYILTTIDPTGDYDGDIIANRMEDLNNDNDINFEDTDNDGILNFQDNDDDGDGVLSINEDYNHNGSPLDDDTNSNGIADYLDNTVTLATTGFTQNKEVTIYPNPTKDYITINTYNDYLSVEVVDLSGKSLIIKGTNSTFDLSALGSGVYFIKINWTDKSLNYKIIKQ